MTANLMMLDHVLKCLKLPTVGKQYRSVAREAEERNLSYEAFLLALVEQEIHVREENQRQRKLRQAAFPMPKTLDTFEFHLISCIE